MQYNKPPLSIPDQAQRLLDRGMLCDDLPRLHQYLTKIGYYRLSAYWLVYEQGTLGEDGSRDHQFKENTHFNDVLNLYLFDRELRLLLFDVIERIEVAIRTAWATNLALESGSHAYLDPNLFEDRQTYNRGIKKIDDELGRSQETFVAHYRKKYTNPPQPPLWAVVEVLSFGNLSRWLENTASTNVKKDIAKSFGMPKIDTFQQILKALTPLRNDCAHHSRIWNRRYTMATPTIRRIADSYNLDRYKQRNIYNFIVTLAYLLDHINPKSTWKGRLATLVSGRPLWQRQQMGFPDDWQDREIWKRANENGEVRG